MMSASEYLKAYKEKNYKHMLVKDDAGNSQINFGMVKKYYRNQYEKERGKADEEARMQLQQNAKDISSQRENYVEKQDVRAGAGDIG